MSSIERMILLFAMLAMVAGICIGQETGGARGVVRNRSYRALGEVNVTASQNGKDIKSVRTNQRGEFELTGLKAGKYDFVFAKDGFNTGTLKNVELGKKIRNIGSGLMLEPDEGTFVIIKGLVFDQDGHSIPGAEVLVEKIVAENNVQKIKTVFSNSGWDAGDRGEFTVHLPEGPAKYRLTAAFRGKSASKDIDVDIAAVYRTAITLNVEKEKDQQQEVK